MKNSWVHWMTEEEAYRIKELRLVVPRLSMPTISALEGHGFDKSIGNALCRKAADILGEDYTKPPWNGWTKS